MMNKNYLTTVLSVLAICQVVCSQVTYNYTGGVQSYKVPCNVDSIRVKAWGAGGGGGGADSRANSTAGPGGYGGGGAYAETVVPVSAGDIIKIYVGGGGGGGTGCTAGTGAGLGGYGYGTGGNGANSGPDGCSGSGGAGGGSSAVFDSTANTLLIAGAGGGGGGGGGFNAVPESAGGGGENGNYNSSAGETPATTGGNATLNGGAGGSIRTDGGGGGGGGGGATYGGAGGSAPDCDCGAGGGAGGNSVGDTVIIGNGPAPGDSTDASLCSGCARGGAGAVLYNNYTAPAGGNGLIIITPVITSTSFAAQVSPNDTVICPGASVALHAAGGTGYLWSPANGLDSVASANPVATPDSSVTYSVAISAGACADTISVLITVLQGAAGVPGAIIPALDTVCNGGIVQLVDTGSSGTIRWQSSADGISFSGISGANTDTFTSTSLTQVTYYRVQASGACSADSSGVSTVRVNPVPLVKVQADKNNFCTGDSAQVCATAGFSSYNWNTGVTGTGNCIMVGQGGNYYVTVTDAHGCSAESNQDTLGIYPVPAVAISSNKNIFCSGDSAQVCATSGFSLYQWNAGVSGTGNCIEVEEAGDYYVTVTDVHSCTAESNRLAINTYPVPAISLQVQGNKFSSFGQVSYQWYLDGTPIDSATGPVYNADQAGSYTLEVTDSNGCTAMSSAIVATGLNELTEDESVLLYPNPSAGKCQLVIGNDLIGSSIKIYDEEGRIVYQSEIRSPNSEIDLDAAPGVYWLRISSADGNIVKKLMKF